MSLLGSESRFEIVTQLGDAGKLPHDHLLLDSAPNLGPLISRSDLNKFKNCWNKSFRTSKILTLLYQQFSNLLISRRDMSLSETVSYYSIVFMVGSEVRNLSGVIDSSIRTEARFAAKGASWWRFFRTYRAPAEMPLVGVAYWRCARNKHVPLDVGRSGACPPRTLLTLSHPSVSYDPRASPPPAMSPATAGKLRSMLFVTSLDRDENNLFFFFQQSTSSFRW